LASRPPSEHHRPSDPAEWVDRHGDALFRFAMLRVRDRDRAEELVQEAVLAAFRARDRFEGRSAERTWLIQILKNKIADFYRRRRREVPATDVAAEPEAAEDLFDHKGRWETKPVNWAGDPGALRESEEFLAVLRECMDGLPERQAEGFSLRVRDERTTDEVTNLLTLTRTNLGVLLHRARMKLRRCLEASWFGEGGG